MEVVYNWSVKKMYAKPLFTDKHGNVRENALKKVVLECEATYSGKSEKMTSDVVFDLIDLTNFVSIDQLSIDQVLQWSLDKLDKSAKAKTEQILGKRFKEISTDNKIIEINL